jgi:8-oxo-dGTP diphosphatase|tara:strand:- start:81 stop:473 length:393 start_codon:yes stop_codon:yes gene_type:complete
MKKVEVAAAIVIDKGEILCVQRGKHKFSYISEKFEFPGGKIEEGETLKETVIRELEEELMLDVVPEKKFLTVEHQYPDFHLTMHVFLCSCKDRKLKLTEHIYYKWLEPKDLKPLDWAAADIPIVNKILNL